MKPAPTLLLNVLVVGLGLLLYDTLRGVPTSPTEVPRTGDPAPRAAEGGGLRGSAEQMRAHSSEERIRGLEAAVARLQADVEKLRAGRSADTPGAAQPAGPIEIDESTLRWLGAYREELIRREGEARGRARMAEEFARKGVMLSQELMERVVAETLAFHERAKTLMRTPVERSAGGLAERTRAVHELRAGFASIVNGLVPADQAERILETRMGRARDILPSEED